MNVLYCYMIVPGNIVKYYVAFYSAKSTDIRGLHVTYAILLFTVVMLELQYYRLCTHFPLFVIGCGDVTEVHGRVSIGRVIDLCFRRQRSELEVAGCGRDQTSLVLSPSSSFDSTVGSSRLITSTARDVAAALVCVHWRLPSTK